MFMNTILVSFVVQVELKLFSIRSRLVILSLSIVKKNYVSQAKAGIPIWNFQGSKIKMAKVKKIYTQQFPAGLHEYKRGMNVRSSLSYHKK